MYVVSIYTRFPLKVIKIVKTSMKETKNYPGGYNDIIVKNPQKLSWNHC